MIQSIISFKTITQKFKEKWLFVFKNLKKFEQVIKADN